MIIDYVVGNDAEAASFNRFPFKDVNPQSGRTKVRWISAPNEEMSGLHTRFIKYLRNLKVDHSSSIGSREHFGPLQNIEPHLLNRFFYLTDLVNAYPSVDGSRLAEVLYGLDLWNSWNWKFRFAESPEAFHGFLKRCCLDPKGGLRVGANSSPDIFNIYCAQTMDGKIRELCAQYGITYTRYLDDLTFSSMEPIGQKKRKKINRVIREAGFQISDTKTVIADIMEVSVLVTGLRLNYLPRNRKEKREFCHRAIRISLSKQYLEHLNGLLYASKLPSKVEANFARVQGKMGLIRLLRKRYPGATKREAKLLNLYTEYLRNYHFARQ